VAGHPLAFADEDGLVVPWEVTLCVMQSLARRHAELLLRELGMDEKRRSGT
jgi:hypothetical protein